MSASNLLELQGLESAKATLPKLWEPNSGVHAVLIYGPSGSGKTTLADILTRAWLCQSPTESGACGRCSACLASQAGTNVDRLDIAPLGASRWIKVAQITAVKTKDDDVQTAPVTEFVRTMPIQSRKKVIVIEDAERCTKDASNALLKTLEEPPEYARLILISSAMGNVSRTLISRCVLVGASGPNGLGERGISVGESIRLEQDQERQEALRAIARASVHVSPTDALKLSEEFRNLLGRGDEDEGVGKRQQQTELLEAFADALLARGESEKAKMVIEAHRRVLGNANFGLVVDGLFTSFLA